MKDCTPAAVWKNARLLPSRPNLVQYWDYLGQLYPSLWWHVTSPEVTKWLQYKLNCCNVHNAHPWFPCHLLKIVMHSNNVWEEEILNTDTHINCMVLNQSWLITTVQVLSYYSFCLWVSSHKSIQIHSVLMSKVFRMF